MHKDETRHMGEMKLKNDANSTAYLSSHTKLLINKGIMDIVLLITRLLAT